MKKTILLIGAVLAALSINASADTGITNSSKVGHIEVGFSPEGSAQDLIVKLIGKAQNDIKILSYSFTSPEVVKALVKAKRRGVNVSIAADSSNLTSKSGQAALSTLKLAGVAVRTVDHFKIMHDKIIVVDNMHVESGSFNYSKAANSANSENALVLWDAPEIAASYARHWKSRWDLGTEFTTRF